jgi:hypothetical protein
LDGKVNIEKDQDLGFCTGKGKYGNGIMELDIYDCAGTNSGMAGLFFEAYNTKSLNEDQLKYYYRERNGIKTVENYKTDQFPNAIVFLYHNRWYVVLKADNMNPDKIWDSFDMKALKKFKN